MASDTGDAPTPSPSLAFDHIGLVVRTIPAGRRHLSRMLSVSDWSAVFDDPVNDVIIQFGRDPAGVCYELLAPRGPDSPVMGAMETGKAILNHVAYRTADLTASAAALRATGCMPTAEPKPAIAYGGRPVQFFITPLRFIIELIEAPDHRHAYLDAFQA